jgi:16S rRNA (cytosine1402-N4)-methyltransferase
MAHIPVLLDAVLEWLPIRPEGTYVDCTLGAGGYAEAIAGRLTIGRLIAIDRDPEAIERVKARLGDAGGRIEYVRSSYGELERILEGTLADGIVADLGLSRDQIEDPARGFSFSTEGPLDMRMDPDGPLTAADIVNTYGEKPLADLIYQFGEERRSRRIARAIVRARPLTSTRQLAEAIGRAAPRTPRDRIHPATRTFQALRIAVNDELAELQRLLEAAPPRLAPGGRFLVVSFHSLEDRLVKQALRRWAGLGLLQILTKHVVWPDEAETERNPASRSARLRVAERKVDEWL